MNGGRLATKKKNIVKMGGAYHGWNDQLAYGLRIPGTKGLQFLGVPGYIFQNTQEVFSNDLHDLERVLRPETASRRYRDRLPRTGRFGKRHTACEF